MLFAVFHPFSVSLIYLSGNKELFYWIQVYIYIYSLINICKLFLNDLAFRKDYSLLLININSLS